MKKFTHTTKYSSSFVSVLKQKATLNDRLKKNLSPIIIDCQSVNIILPRSFGFCYGVENAIEITQQAIDNHYPQKRIFLLGELIHNQYINNYFLEKGVRFLMNSLYEPLIDLDTLTSDDIVIVPAFGAPIWVEEKLNSLGLDTAKYASTCPFVERVWNRAHQLIEKQYTIIIHGTPKHEETESTKSRIAGLAPFIVVRNVEETEKLLKFIRQEGTQEEFEQCFKNQYSQGFDIKKDLKRIGIINQTTMIAKETQIIMDLIKKTSQMHYQVQEDDMEEYFAKTRDTLCYATNDNQNSLTFVIENLPIDLAIAIGGYNSSNTSHLVEMSEEKVKTFFISSSHGFKNKYEISHFNIHTRQVQTSKDYLAHIFQKINEGGKPNILFLSGASCPDISVEQAIHVLLDFLPKAKLPEDIQAMINV